MAYSVEPKNKSFLSNNKYEFVITRLPHVTFFVQSINLPAITLNSVQVPSPFTTINRPGNILVYEPLTINYIVDEEMRSWSEIYDWVNALGNPTTKNKLGDLTFAPGKNNSVTSDATLLVKSNANNPLLEFRFKDVFPTELTGVQFTSTETQEFLTSSITFAYTFYTATKLYA